MKRFSCADGEYEEGDAEGVFERADEVLVAAEPLQQQTLEHTGEVLDIERIEWAFWVSKPDVEICDQDER